MTDNFPLKSQGIDLRAVIEIPLRQFIWWLVMVLLASFSGYPGVVCVTPMAWLIALRVGVLCVLRSRSESSSQRLLEAALAGGLLGLLQGILFTVVVPFMGPIKASEWGNMIVITVLMVVVGVAIGAGLSFFTAYLREQRNRAN